MPLFPLKPSQLLKNVPRWVQHNRLKSMLIGESNCYLFFGDNETSPTSIVVIEDYVNYVKGDQRK